MPAVEPSAVPVVELRSDTFTLPTPEMRAAAATAAVGDDVWGEDPTVAALEADAAAATGKDAALFVPSGTMGNLCAVLSHCDRRGSAILLGDQSHIFVYEQGGASTLGGVSFHTLTNTPNGELPLDALTAALATPDDPHFARPALVCLENTHNRCGGAVVSLAHMAAVKKAAAAAGIPVHLDGARLANAVAALIARGEIAADDPRPLAAACASVHSVSLCLSKGLGAPVGSVLCGDAAFIGRARRARKALGGGMRQAGVLAAPGRLALARWRDLAADNANSAALAAGLAAIPHIHVLPGADSNIVVFGPADNAPFDSDDLVVGLADRGVRVAAMRGRVRAVTSSEVDRAGVEKAVAAAAAVVDAAVAGTLQSGRKGAAYGGLTDADTRR